MEEVIRQMLDELVEEFGRRAVLNAVHPWWFENLNKQMAVERSMLNE